MSANNTLKINIPTIATKQLKLQSCNAGKKLVVSTNWLPLFGFDFSYLALFQLDYFFYFYTL